MKRLVVKKVQGERNGNPWYAVVLGETFDAAKGVYTAEKMVFIRSIDVWNQLEEQHEYVFN